MRLRPPFRFCSLGALVYAAWLWIHFAEARAEAEAEARKAEREGRLRAAEAKERDRKERITKRLRKMASSEVGPDDNKEAWSENENG